MMKKSYIFTTIALLLGLFTGGLFITLPICFIIALIGLYYGVNNYVKNKVKNDFIVNFMPLAYSGFVIVLLIFMFLYLLKIGIIDNVALVMF